MQKALIAVLHSMLRDEERLLTGVWAQMRRGEMRTALMGALLPSERVAAC